MRGRGFSMLEILISAGIMTLILTAVSSMMYTVLRSARKSSAVAAAKTEGAYALRSMDQMMRFATNISCLGANSVRITRLNEDTVTYSLSGTGIASDSGTVTQSLTSNNVRVTTCPGGIAVFTCDVASSTGRIVKICFVINKSGGVDVTDTAGTNGVTFQTQVAIRNWGN